MIKSLCLKAALISVAILVKTGAVSARADDTFGRMPASPTTQLEKYAVPYHRSPATFVSLAYTGGDRDYEGDHKDEDKDKREDKDNDKDDRAPSPAPEPSTILSFGVALLIGGGALLSRRAPRRRK